MIRSALLLCAALLATSCVYQPPYQASQRPAPALLYKPLVGITSISPCDAPTFVASIKILKASYSPNVPPGQYRPPYTQIDNTVTLRKEIQQDLSDAFTNSPLFFKNHLCNDLRRNLYKPEGLQ